MSTKRQSKKAIQQVVVKSKTEVPVETTPQPQLLVKDRFNRTAIFDPNAKPPFTGYSFAYGNDVIPEDIPLQVGDPNLGVNGGSEFMLLGCLTHILKNGEQSHFNKVASIHLSIAALIMEQEDIYQQVISKFPNLTDSEKEAIQCYLLNTLFDQIADDEYLNAVGDILENQDAYMYLDSSVLEEIKTHLNRA